jgi:hypothetical protein
VRNADGARAALHIAPGTHVALHEVERIFLGDEMPQMSFSKTNAEF